MGSMWGLSPWGFTPWGLVGPISLLEAYPLGPRAVFVRFSTEPQFASPVSFGDVGNRATWSLTREDTGARIEVIGAERQNLPEEWRLFLLSPLGPSRVSHTLSCPTLRSKGLAPATVPFSVDFFGVDEVVPAIGPRSRAPRVVDLRSDYFFGRGAALRPDAGGNLPLQSGKSGLQKRLYRLLTTRPGEDPGDPAFGCLLELKELLRDPRGEQARIEAAVLRDPEVAAARVSLELRDEGLVLVEVTARMRTGGEEQAAFKVDAGGVRYGAET